MILTWKKDEELTKLVNIKDILKKNQAIVKINSAFWLTNIIQKNKSQLTNLEWIRQNPEIK